jgi:hypothetical protein
MLLTTEAAITEKEAEDLEPAMRAWRRVATRGETKER